MSTRNHIKALIDLGDYDEAQRQLAEFQAAQQLEAIPDVTSATDATGPKQKPAQTP